MILLPLLAEASAPALPKVIDPGISYTDYPASALQGLEQGSELVRVIVSPSGDVLGCQIAIPSKFADLDAAACPGMKRAKFSPGRNRNGDAAYSLFENWVTWSIGGALKQPDTIDVELTVNHLPQGSPAKPVSKLALIVSKSGAVESCSVVRSSGNESLDGVACSSGVQSARISPLTDENNNPVESVQPLNVAFSAEKASSK